MCRHVECIPWVAGLTELTVVSRPIELRVMPYLIDFANLFNLKPAPQYMQFRSTPDKAPTGTSFLHSLEEAEEKEYIPGFHTLIRQVSLRSTGLSEEPAPAIRAMGKSFRADVGVQPYNASRFVSSDSEVFHYLSDIGIALIQVSVTNRPPMVALSNRQRIHRSIGENGAGTASVFAIKPFSAEY